MLKLENDKLLVEIGRGRGARVERFLDKSINRDWVWKPKSKIEDEDLPVSSDKSFDQFWAGGWEEVFPNDASTEINGFKLPDHGEAWRRHWFEEVNGDNQVKFSLHCENYPLLLKKTFKLDEVLPRLIVNYEIISVSDQALPFIFKIHPPIAIEAGDRFIMPESVMKPIAIDFSRIIGSPQVSRYPFGIGKNGLRVSIDKALENDGYSREFVDLTELSSGSCSIYNPDSRTELKFEFPSNILNHIWLFESFGGFLNHYVVMPEPTNTGHYDLAVAAHEKSCGTINPEEKISFSVIISLFKH
jgi:hypothetical protein